jgi:hypothetical protein
VTKPSYSLCLTYSSIYIYIFFFWTVHFQ